MKLYTCRFLAPFKKIIKRQYHHNTICSCSSFSKVSPAPATIINDECQNSFKLFRENQLLKKELQLLRENGISPVYFCFKQKMQN